jgi:hypothetical protein
MKETIKKIKEVLTPKKEEVVVVPPVVVVEEDLPENKRRWMR